ncbi:hypothetical protein [Streptosporangium sp. KLBMP 9127]|nr:hypothetical protein [Streptosporangium sp. KLBMP 9127]
MAVVPSGAQADTSDTSAGWAAPVVAPKPKIVPVPKVQAPPAGTVEVPRAPSLAAQPVEARQVGPEAPQVTIPAGPTLINRIADTAKARLKSQGLDGPDASELLPPTGEADVLTVSKPLTDQIGKVADGVKRLSGVDLQALYRASPRGIPLLTYRLCAESPTLKASCSIPQPLLKPMAADVTGDGTPDVMGDVVPVVKDMKGLTSKSGALSAGVGLTVSRLPGSERRDGPLKAQVWAEYDLPGSRRMAIGFDGHRRGTSLSGTDWGVFTVGKAVDGVVDVKASVRRSEPGGSIATVASLATITNGQATSPTLVSLRQSPVPQKFTADVKFDTAKLESTLKITASHAARLDAIVLTSKRATSQVTHMVVEGLRASLTAKLTRPAKNGAADIRLTGADPIPKADLHNYVYQGRQLAKVAAFTLSGLPTRFHARYQTAGAKQGLTVETGAPHAKAVDVVYFDRAAAKTVLSAKLTDLPGRVELVNDTVTHKVTHRTSSEIGRFEATLQRNEGAVSVPDGGHVTMIKDGGRLGVSGRLSGLAGFDVTYGAKPRAVLRLDSSGQSFLGAASIDGTHLTRMEISNTPAKVQVDVDPAAKKAEYTASGVIERLRAAYANTRTGPTIDGTMHGVRSTVGASWKMGEKTEARVTAGSGLKKFGLYVNRAHVTRIDPKSGQDLDLSLQDVRRRVAVVADLAARSLDWTADEPVTAVSALARIRSEGRDFRVAAKVTGVPAHFDASWNRGSYRFRGVSGPIGSAQLAVTNHDGAQAPTGPHLAAHYRESTKDMDASVRIDGLSNVEFSGSGTDFTADFQSGKQTIALDTDVSLAGDLRFGALGTLGPVPGKIAVSVAKGGPITYDTGGAHLDLKAKVWLGKTAALQGSRDTPAFASGLSMVDSGCKAGSPGCAGDAGPFCTDHRGCFGVRGFISLTGLPTKVTVDLAKKTFAFAGFRPKDKKLGVYLDSRILAPVPIKVSATLDGLPESITAMTFGPFEVGDGKDPDGRAAAVVKANYRIDPATTITSLDAQAEAMTPVGAVRGQVAVHPVPAAVAINGTYGNKTRIGVQNSAVIDELLAKVTVIPRDRAAGTGLVRFTDVPAKFDVGADAAGTGLRVPTFGYRAAGGENTLDGLFAVQGALIEQFYRPKEGRLLDASFGVTDLASDTTIKINPDLSADLVSRPVPTKLLQLHAGLTVEPIKPQKIYSRADLPYTTGLFAFQLDGHFGFRRSTIKNLALGIHGVSWMKIRPGKIPFEMDAPKALGFVSPGFEGAYDHIDLGASGIDLKPDVNLNVKLDRKIGPDAYSDTLKLGPAKSLEFRRYDGRMRPISTKRPVKAGPAEGCLTISTKPGLAAARGTNAITLYGKDGPQMVSLIDPGSQVQDYAIDLLSHFMSPYPGAAWEVTDFSTGACR